MRSWTGGFEVLGGGVGAGVFVVAGPDGDAVGGAWGGLLGEFASEVLTHLADGQGCEVGEDLSAGGGGVVEQGQEEVVGADPLRARAGPSGAGCSQGPSSPSSVFGMCPEAGAEPAGALTPSSLVSSAGAVTPHEVSAAVPGPPASKIWGGQVFGADGVLVVGAGGAGGKDDHLTGLIGESLEHHDALPPRRRRERREQLRNSLLFILGVCRWLWVGSMRPRNPRAQWCCDLV